MRTPTGTAGSRGRDDEGGALLVVVMAMLVATSLGILILGVVLAQARPTAFARKNVSAASAAEAGFSAALSQLRTATSVTAPGVIEGDRELLPCDPSTHSATITGQVSGSASAPRYEVDVRYFIQDPAHQSEAWRDANRLECDPVGGPVRVPHYALLESDGMGPGPATAGDRKVETVYEFQLENRNTSGGPIHHGDGNALNPVRCLDAGSAAPALSTILTVQSCVVGAAQQKFAWQKDYSIVLTSTQGDPSRPELCVTADPSGPVGAYAHLAKCDGTFKQKWGFSNHRHFYALPRYSLSVKDASDARCMDAAGVVGAQVTLTSMSVSPTVGQCVNGEQRRKWSPEAITGSGGVGDNGPTLADVADKELQWVNYLEFGRCIDVPNRNINSPSAQPELILYPCKQDPRAKIDAEGDPQWNQTLMLDSASSTIYTWHINQGFKGTFKQARDGGGSRVCLTSPGSSGGFVWLSSCVTGSTTQQWTVKRETGRISDSFTIVDRAGRCLGNGAVASHSPYPAPVVEACVPGDPGQKWNAPPGAVPAALQGTQEIYGG
ncbi:ricin-type beta-trefoil lectin protein [Kineococcus xinjiangensis]|uniref:Ricin-type beta-trefoil lectin protein n=1 Tax=Kineococcus xinjiangensis TaxID=512762 RepID=A0A2S6IP48_9ACTN|nr:ricin-type beta-trefoil lectin domain protein [Kineococcus xinjiangensis]PPK95999.1 ricin-type beta-trefoil lectin protein [Kineococcus xinjiangensis]